MRRASAIRLGAGLGWLAFGLLAWCHGCVAAASWGGGSCGPVGPPALFRPVLLPPPIPATPAPPEPESVDMARVREIAARVRAERAAKKAKAQPCVDGCPCRDCGEACRCCEKGMRCQGDCPCVVTQNFGVDESKLRRDPPENYKLGGQGITRGEAMAAIGKGEVPDDSKLLRLTVIGSEPERKAVLADLEGHPALAPYKGKLSVQAYAPDNWAVHRVGFVTAGHPTIYVQAPGGKVLHRQDVYTGAEKLAEAVRRADPNYSPNKDPDLTRPPAPSPRPALPDISLPSLDLSAVPSWLWAALAAGGGTWLILRRQQ